MKDCKLKIGWTCIVITICIIAILISPVIFTSPAFCDRLVFSSTGEIGDTIGGITAPIIGLVSVVLLYITLKNQINANERQYDMLVRQEKMMRDEQFKSTFFNLLTEQRDLLHSLTAIYHGLSLKDVTKQISVKVCGQNFFDMTFVELKFLFKFFELPNYDSFDDEEIEMLIRNAYEQCFQGLNLPEELKRENEENIRGTKEYVFSLYFRNIFVITKDDFLKYIELENEEEKLSFVYGKYYTKRENSGCYFRHLYRILSFIEEAEDQDVNVSGQNRKQIEKNYFIYAQFVQAQMSTKEMIAVYYNSFSFPKLKRLLIKYDLLRNLTIENLICPRHYCCKEFHMEHRTEFKWNE